ncbi:MAG: uncharacterized membrane protein YraQ (UPF0718 family) [Oleispira sp.]|jgi:uncharacterized membrane protein YraQ (UPF0718 family)
MMALIDDFIFLFTESALYLLLGLLLTGIVRMLVPDSWIIKFLVTNSLCSDGKNNRNAFAVMFLLSHTYCDRYSPREC